MAGTFDSSWITKVNSDVANQANARGQEQYDSLKGQAAKNVATAADVSARAIDTSKGWDTFASNERDRYTTNWAPAEKEQLDFARGYTSPDRLQRNRGAAVSAQTSAGEAAKQKSMRTLSDYGIGNPGSGKTMALDRISNVITAGQGAAAGTQSDINTEAMGQQYLAQAINTGKTIPQMAAGAAGVGLQAGSLGVNAPIAAAGSQAQTLGTPAQWSGIALGGFNGASQAMQGSANIANQADQLENSKSSGTGALIGAGLGVLGSVAGSFFGPAGTMIGGALGRAAGGAATGEMSVARGGLIRNFAAGGPVDDMDMDEGMGGYDDMDGDEGMYVDPSMSPSGGAATDDVPAQIDGDPNQPAHINAGEFVMPKDVVMWRGEAWMQKEIKKAREEMAQTQNRPAQPEMTVRPPVGPGQPNRYAMGAAA